MNAWCSFVESAKQEVALHNTASSIQDGAERLRSALLTESEQWRVMYGRNIRDLGLRLIQLRCSFGTASAFSAWREVAARRKARRRVAQHLDLFQDGITDTPLLQTIWGLWSGIASEERLWRVHFAPVVKNMQQVYRNTVSTLVSRNGNRSLEVAYIAWSIHCKSVACCRADDAYLSSVQISAMREQSIEILDHAAQAWMEEGGMSTARALLHAWWSCTCRDRVLAHIAQLEERTCTLLPLYRWLQSILQRWRSQALLHKRLGRPIQSLLGRLTEVRRDETLREIVSAWRLVESSSVGDPSGEQNRVEEDVEDRDNFSTGLRGARRVALAAMLRG
jgi:hypothetical protein